MVKNAEIVYLLYLLQCMQRQNEILKSRSWKIYIQKREKVNKLLIA